jgi:hypothetical protein
MAECKAACRLHLTILNRHNIGSSKKSWRRFCMRLAVRQVVFTDVITIWRHLKESLRPQFSYEKADMMDGLPAVQEQS